MKKLIYIVALIVLSTNVFAAGSYGTLPGSWTAPVVFGATNTVVSVSTMGATAGPTEVSGNPVYSSLKSLTDIAANPFYTNIIVQNVDPSSDIYCAYTSNVSTSTTTGINGAGVMGMRICGSSASLSTPPTCPPSQQFGLAPYQKFYCVSGETGSATSSAIILKWR